MPDDIFAHVDHLILNETETEILHQLAPGSLSATEEGLSAVSKSFLDKGVKTVVITLGENGAYYNTMDRTTPGTAGIWLPAQRAKVVDTTAAGDTFLGAYAVRIASALADFGTITGAVIGQAVEFAVLAAAKAVEKPGAQSSIPWLDEIRGLEVILPELAPVSIPGEPTS